MLPLVLMLAIISGVSMREYGDLYMGICSDMRDCAPNGFCADILGRGMCVCQFGKIDDVGNCLPVSDRPGAYITETKRDQGSEPDTILMKHVSEPIKLHPPAKCPNLKFGSLKVPLKNRVCFNEGKCFHENKTVSHCACDRGFYGKTCGQKMRFNAVVELKNATYREGLKFVNPRHASNIIGRHFGLDVDDCLKHCTMTGKKCHSVNFGSYSNVGTVCELIGVIVFPGSQMELNGYLQVRTGWTYAYDQIPLRFNRRYDGNQY